MRKFDIWKLCSGLALFFSLASVVMLVILITKVSAVDSNVDAVRIGNDDLETMIRATNNNLSSEIWSAESSLESEISSEASDIRSTIIIWN